ncbi:DUF423 domain-containing protein [Porticoccaceae bacterium]|nr:DUF423 domain-containing protein [Porticoccaceae bacterium]
MNKPRWIQFVALSGALAVALGAFAAHGLEASLSAKYLATFRTAVLYQFLHTLALMGLICLPDGLVNSRLQTNVAQSFALGILLFSGSLYLLVATGISALGMITPLGGLAFIAGWLTLLVASRRSV